jgi:hypothetical protein
MLQPFGCIPALCRSLSVSIDTANKGDKAMTNTLINYVQFDADDKTFVGGSPQAYP